MIAEDRRLRQEKARQFAVVESKNARRRRSGTFKDYLSIYLFQRGGLALSDLCAANSYRPMRDHLFLTILIGLFTANSLPAQSWQWAEQGTGDNFDLGIGLATDQNGNVFASGVFFSSEIIFGADTLINDAPGFGAAYLVKYDPDGNVLWAKSSEGDGTEAAGVTTDGLGNAIVFGAFGEYGTFMSLDGNVLDCAGVGDGYIAKYDPSGALQWAAGFGGEENDGVAGVATDSSGNTYATGAFSSDSITFGPFTLHRHLSSAADMFVVALDPDGNVLWARSEGGEYWDAGRSIAIDLNSDVIVTGVFGGSVDFGGTILASMGGDDVCLLKFDASGVPIWAKKIGGTGDDNGKDVISDADGYIYLAGTLQSSICYIGTTLFLNPASPSTDVFIAKFDFAGSVVWAEHGQGWGWEYVGGIAIDGNNNLQVAGYFSGDTATFGSVDLINADPGFSNDDIFLVTYDTGGLVLATQHPGANGIDKANDVATDSSGNVFITGNFSSPSLMFGTHVLSAPGFYGDCFIAKLGAITTDVPLHDNTNAMGIHPDPVVDHMIVTSKDPISVNDRIEVLDMDGRIVRSMRGNGTHQVRIQRDDLRSGMYLLRILPASGSLLRQIGLAGVARVVFE